MDIVAITFWLFADYLIWINSIKKKEKVHYQKNQQATKVVA